jgi:heat shock protein HslJ
MNLRTCRAIASIALAGLLSACATVSPAADTPSLVGTAWVLSALPGHTPVAGSIVTLRFEASRASGSAGCNQYSGTYTSSGSSLTFGPAATTRMMCAEPEGLMEQEQRFLQALRSVASARLEGDRLELRSTDGALAISLTRVPAP